MTFYLRNTSILFKVSFSVSSLDRDSFKQLFEEAIKKFPLKDEYPQIKGIYLNGDRFFQNISINDPIDIEPDSIKKICRITPIIDKTPFPFIYEAGTLEIRLPLNGHSFDTINHLAMQVSDYLRTLNEHFSTQKMELALTGEMGEHLSKAIYSTVIPGLKEGNYKYELEKDNDTETGEITLPVNNTALPQSIRNLDFPINTIYNLKFVANGNRFIIKKPRENEIRLLLYSNDITWFMDTLYICDKENLLERPVPDLSDLMVFGFNRYLPHL